MLSLRARAKINLSLAVTGKREDGYHLLESLVAFADIGDVLHITPADTLSLELRGPFAHMLQQDSNNLVLKAAHLLRQATGCAGGAHIVLEKHLPVGAGIGGGSADAAAALHGLCRLWNLTLPQDILLAMALRLGSDVPVCMAARPRWMCGIGEELRDVNIPDMALLLVNPNIHLATADVFAHRSGAFSEAHANLPTDFTTMSKLIAFLQNTHNALEAPAIALAPVIAELLHILRHSGDCMLARMSGSGATCFGLYPSLATAMQAANHIQQAHPKWWCAATTLTSYYEQEK